MESTAQYWKPVWGALERYWKPIARSGKVPARCRERSTWRKRNRIAVAVGRKKDFPDAERLVKRLVADELSSELCARCRTASLAHRHAAGSTN